MNWKKTILIIVSILLLVAIFVTPIAQAEKNKRIKIFVSFYPLYDVAEKIGRDQIDLHLIVPNGVEVHSYELSPKKIAELESADLFFYNGAGLESWVDKLLKTLKITAFNVSEVIELLKVNDVHCFDPNQQHETHGLNQVEEDTFGEVDPHIWLDPLNMKIIARLMADCFIEADSENEEIYQKNYLIYSREIETLDCEYKETLDNRKRDYILVSHAAFSYLAKRYDVKILSVAGISPHFEPSPKTIVTLIREAKEHKLEYIFLETLASPKTVRILAEEAKLKILTLNPIAGLTKEEIQNGDDYFSLMRKNLENLKKALVE